MWSLAAKYPILRKIDMAKKRKKIPVDGDGPSLPDDRFASLAGLFSDDDGASPKGSDKGSVKVRKSQAPGKSSSSKSSRESKNAEENNARSPWKAEKTRKGNYDIRLEKRGGGKTVTVLSRISGDLKILLRELRKKCAGGGAIKGDTIEIQGDHEDKIDAYLKECSS